MEDYAVDLLARMVKTYSPSGEEDDICELLVAEMRSLGLSSHRDEVGNAVGEFGEGEPTVLLCGHMDTVPGRLPFKMSEGRIYGRGAVDAKPALAAMIVASSILLKEEFDGKVVVVGAVDEEGTGKGVKHLVDRGVSPDYAVFGEPSGVDSVTIAYKGSLHLKVTCETDTGHSSAPWLFENAVEKSIEVWDCLKKVRLSIEREASRFYSLTSCITGISGGGSHSVVPPRCEMNIDLRFPPGLSTETVLREIDSRLEEYRNTHPTVSVNRAVEDACEAFETDKRSPLVKAFTRSIRRVKGRPATLLRKTGTGDMNVFAASAKVPAVTYGAGNSRLDHTSNEHVDIEEYVDSIKVYCEGLRRLRQLDRIQRSRKRLHARAEKTTSDVP